MSATKIPAGTVAARSRYRYRRSSDQKAWRAIEDIFPAGSRLRLHRDVRNIVNLHIGRRAIWSEAPRASVVAGGLRNTRNQIDTAAQKVASLSAEERHLIDRTRAREVSDFPERVETFELMLLDLVRYIDKALAMLPTDRGGRVQDLPLRTLVEGAAAFYEREANQKATAHSEGETPFVTLIHALLLLAGDDRADAAGGALGKQVQRLLRRVN